MVANPITRESPEAIERRWAQERQQRAAPRADWSEWSEARERDRIAKDIAQHAQERDLSERELSERIADDHFKKAFPDWRLLRRESHGLFRHLLAKQPEMKQREIRSRGDMLHLIRTNLPPHIRELVTDLELLNEFVQIAHEGAAFLCGYALGRKSERVYLDSRGRVRHAPPKTTGNRLHMDGGER
jgi:hypothetical protein